MNRNQLKSIFSTDTPLFGSSDFYPAQRAALETVRKIIDTSAVELPGPPQQAAPSSVRCYAPIDLGNIINQIFSAAPVVYKISWSAGARKLCGAILAKKFNRPALGSALGYGTATEGI